MHLCIETLTRIDFTFPSQAYLFDKSKRKYKNDHKSMVDPCAFWHHFHFSKGGQIFWKSTIHISMHDPDPGHYPCDPAFLGWIFASLISKII
jgi:hypothetical protein